MIGISNLYNLLFFLGMWPFYSNPAGKLSFSGTSTGSRKTFLVLCPSQLERK